MNNRDPLLLFIDIARRYDSGEAVLQDAVGDDDGEAKEVLTMDTYISVEAMRAAPDGRPAPVVIDVRGADEYRAGHLPEALHIPVDDVPERIAELPADRPVVTYCNLQHRGHARSEHAASLLRAAGLEATTLDGGFPAWEAAGYPVERGSRQPSSRADQHGQRERHG